MKNLQTNYKDDKSDNCNLETTETTPILKPTKGDCKLQSISNSEISLELLKGN